MEKKRGYPVQELNTLTDPMTEQEEYQKLLFGQVTRTYPSPPKPDPKLRRLIGIASVIAGLLILAMVLMVLLVNKDGRETPEDAAEEYILFHARNKGKKLKEVLIPADLQSEVSEYTKKLYDLPVDEYIDRMLTEANTGAQLRNIKVEVGMELTGTDVLDFQEAFYKAFHVTPAIESLVRVSISYEVTGTFRYEYHPDWEPSGISVKCFKYKGRWYCY